MNSNILCGKRFTFESAHTIVGHPTCGFTHGHTWTLDVQIKGQINETNGMLIDFKRLGQVVKTITNRLDHRMINDEVDFAPVTAETLVRHIAQEIALALDPWEVERMTHIICRLQEGPGGYAEFVEEL